jgi:predicted Zn-dependent protease
MNHGSTIKTKPVKYTYLLCCLLILSLTTCSEDGDFNVFSVEQDLELGRETAQQIRSNPAEYPILDPADYPQAYLYLQNMVDEIVREGNVPYADVFPYQVTLIRSDQQNAFATPGGFIYVYTGLVDVLDSGDQLAGVLAHEIAHASQRHSTDQLTKQYGISTLISVVSGGDPGLLSQIGSQLLSLKFSRDDESEADARSVDFLCNTDYASNGAAGFFEMIQGMGSPPAFLSTHPNPGDRVADINARAADKNCATDTSDIDDFRDFKQRLP